MAARAEAPTTTTAAVERRLRRGRLDVGSRLFELALLASLLFGLVVLIVLLSDVVRDSLSVFAERGTSFLTRNLSSIASRAGVRQGLLGSLLLALIVAAVAFPLGVGAAVYLEEYASDSRLTRFINVNIRNLAGVPSIVYGLLGLAVFVELVFHRRSLFAGGATLAVLVLPIVIITTAEALRAVPPSLREAAFGVGATRWEVVRHHVLPYAMPGILTGTILSLARAIGETAPLILAGAIVGGFFRTTGGLLQQLNQGYTALPVTIFVWARDPKLDFRVLTAAAIVVLLIVVLLVNTVAIVLRNRYERKW
ncbi:MAG TPA: phosphate ABC transporter permease PstA [Actinomycetes bacterium]|nr:phosphate ABC transporter permease PstA [Actinomycetes bacterium]